jgi:hypothetical protein
MEKKKCVAMKKYYEQKKKKKIDALTLCKTLIGGHELIPLFFFKENDDGRTMRRKPCVALRIHHGDIGSIFWYQGDTTREEFRKVAPRRTNCAIRPIAKFA